MEFTIDTSDLDDLSRRYAGAQPIIEGELRTAMTRSVLQIEADAKRLVPTDTHNLQRSITHQVTAAGLGIEGRVGTNVPYAEVVEKGRGAGKPMPPAGALLGWMGRHGIPVSAEFVVRRRISRRGIAARPYLKPALEKNKAAISREFEQVAKRVLAKIGGR